MLQNERRLRPQSPKMTLFLRLTAHCTRSPATAGKGDSMEVIT